MRYWCSSPSNGRTCSAGSNDEAAPNPMQRVSRCRTGQAGCAEQCQPLPEPGPGTAGESHLEKYHDPSNGRRMGTGQGIAEIRHAGRADLDRFRGPLATASSFRLHRWLGGHNREPPRPHTPLSIIMPPATARWWRRQRTSHRNRAESPTSPMIRATASCSSTPPRTFAAITGGTRTGSRRFRRGSGRASSPGNRRSSFSKRSGATCRAHPC